jgi:hypothetical protein
VLNKLCDKKEIPNCFANKHDIIDITLCKNQEGKEFHNKKCISRECLECGVQKLDDYLKPLIEKVKDEDATWRYWTNKQYSRPGMKPSTGKVLENKTGSIKDLIADLKNDAQILPHHSFVAEWQKNCFEELSKKPPDNSVVMHLDFSENYSTFYQQEISSALWLKNLITVLPLVFFYQGPSCGWRQYKTCNGCFGIFVR